MAAARAARRPWVVVGGVVLLAVAVLASLAVGSLPIHPGTVLRALISPDDSDATLVVRDMRVPRTVVGLAAGAALAMAGVLLQALTRNPLADPRILGISAGASLGVVVAIALFGIATLPGYVWFGIAGAFLAGMLGYGLAMRTRDGASPVTLALAGAALDASLGAVVAAVIVLDGRTFDEFRFWAVGSLAGRNAAVAVDVLPFLAVGGLLALLVARGMDALVLGDDAARGLGHRVGQLRLVAAVAVVVLTGAAVAAAGPVAFIGLAVPHLARALVGGDHRWMLAVALLLGPAMLLLADVLGRVVAPPAEVQAGVVTALVGAPLLVLLVRRARTVTA